MCHGTEDRTDNDTDDRCAVETNEFRFEGLIDYNIDDRRAGERTKVGSEL